MPCRFSTLVLQQQYVSKEVPIWIASRPSNVVVQNLLIVFSWIAPLVASCRSLHQWHDYINVSPMFFTTKVWHCLQSSGGRCFNIDVSDGHVRQGSTKPEPVLALCNPFCNLLWFGPFFNVISKIFHGLKLQGCDQEIQQAFDFRQSYTLSRF